MLKITDIIKRIERLYSFFVGPANFLAKFVLPNLVYKKHLLYNHSCEMLIAEVNLGILNLW
ncbi:MAG TPA: hypothetical protein DD738_07750 [Ruminiclostridium sp.]|nr:hypothetical protein [Ruminiclostridium sp.]